MSLELIHAIVLSITIGISYIINVSSLRPFELQITALIFVVYFILKKTTKLTKNRYDLLDAIVFTFVITNIIIATSGLNSPFFFLSYVLIFTLALLLEPTISIFVSFCLIFVFFLTAGDISSIEQIIPLASLPLITPFAMLLGSEYEKNQQLKKINAQLSHVKQELEDQINQQAHNEEYKNQL